MPVGYASRLYSCHASRPLGSTGACICMRRNNRVEKIVGRLRKMEWNGRGRRVGGGEGQQNMLSSPAFQQLHHLRSKAKRSQTKPTQPKQTQSPSLFCSRPCTQISQSFFFQSQTNSFIRNRHCRLDYYRRPVRLRSECFFFRARERYPQQALFSIDSPDLATPRRRR